MFMTFAKQLRPTDRSTIVLVVALAVYSISALLQLRFVVLVGGLRGRLERIME
jgi:hypothetical protein